MKRAVVPIIVVLFGIGLSACSSTPQTPRQQVNGWTTEVGLSSIDAQINNDLTYLNRASDSRNFSDLTTDCDGFPADIESLYETLPAPDTTLTNDFNNASQSWFSASSTCVKATSFKSADYRRYVNELNAGNRAYKAAMKRLASFGVG